jgi:hypothetical protein
MASLPGPYISRKPGELITAEDWNAMQGSVKQDIAGQIQKAVGDIKKVDGSGNADKLEGKTLKEIEDEVIQRVYEELPGRTGYQMIFKRLKKSEEKVIKHGLKACPLTDVYTLAYFQVVCAVSENERRATFVNFYLYHTSEKKIRFQAPNAATSTVIEIEPVGGTHPFKIPFQDMLDRYGVKYTPTTSLDDLVTDFWTAFFADPSDEFEAEQFCHSPWFERCCREETTVSSLIEHGDLDDLWFQMRPRKTINYPAPATTGTIPLPQNVQISHFDFDTLGVTLLLDPVFPPAAQTDINPGDINPAEAKLMLLLKV